MMMPLDTAKTLSRLRTVQLAPALVCAVLSGCASTSSRDAETWTPKQQVAWQEIVAVPMVPAEHGYRMIRTEPTQGLFPASIGVTRVAVFNESKGVRAYTLCLVRDPRNEFLQWNAAFDDQMAISEVFPIDQRDLAGDVAGPDQVLAAFRTLHARIGFVYAVNELNEHETEMIGALYDVANGEPLASVHARAMSIPPPEDEDKSLGMWDMDSQALVRAAFAGHVYQCIRELISRDQPSATESPEGWTPEGPILPVQWPPNF